MTLVFQRSGISHGIGGTSGAVFLVISYERIIVRDVDWNSMKTESR